VALVRQTKHFFVQIDPTKPYTSDIVPVACSTLQTQYQTNLAYYTTTLLLSKLCTVICTTTVNFNKMQNITIPSTTDLTVTTTPEGAFIVNGNLSIAASEAFAAAISAWLNAIKIMVEAVLTAAYLVTEALLNAGAQLLKALEGYGPNVQKSMKNMHDTLVPQVQTNQTLKVQLFKTVGISKSQVPPPGTKLSDKLIKKIHKNVISTPVPIVKPVVTQKNNNNGNNNQSGSNGGDNNNNQNGSNGGDYNDYQDGSYGGDYNGEDSYDQYDINQDGSYGGDYNGGDSYDMF